MDSVFCFVGIVTIYCFIFSLIPLLEEIGFAIGIVLFLFLTAYRWKHYDFVFYIGIR